jgi:uncharacterized protein YndB with AHSA1/START domain
VHEVTVRTQLRVPAERVFDFLVDNRNDPLWCPLATEVELVEGEPGVGAVYRYQQGQGPGRPAVTNWLRTVEAVRPSRLVWDGAGRGLPYHAEIVLEERGGRTRVRHTNRVTLPSRPEQLVWWTIANVVLRLQLRNLRRELER